MSSERFAGVIRVHPELAHVATVFDRELITKEITNIDPDTMDRFLGELVSPVDITRFSAALLEAGLARVVFRIRDPQGNLVGAPFLDLDQAPEFADDRMLNRFEVTDDQIVPVLELMS